EEVIIKALELSPSRRQQSAAELEADLRNALDILLANGAGGSTVTMAHGAVPRSSGAPLNQNSAKGRAVKAPAPKAPAPMPTPHNPRIAANIPPAGGRPAAQVARGAAMNAAAMNGARQITALNPPLNSPSAGAGTAVSQDSGQLRTLAAAVPPSAAARASSKHAAVSAPQPALGMNTAEHAVLQLRGGNAQAAALATNGAIAVAEKERSNKLPRVSAKGAAVAAAAAPAIDRRSWIHFGSTSVTTFGKWLLAFSVIEALWGAVSILLGIIGIANHGLSMATLQRLGLVWLVVVVALSLYGGQALSRPVYRKGALGGVRRGMQGLALFAYTVIVHLVAIWGATVFISSPGNSALAVIAYTIFGVNVLVAGVL
ncbi:MAG: hypothetical protein KGO05_06610, partial [Chloroflexota bacterium]|nr:hypothetical protein [Chloroflexota bacterium]